MDVPQSIYTDCHSVFWTDREPTLEEQLINRKPTTEVGRGLEELGVTLILAHSPQAKGRIERLWNTFQDRLVSELRLAKAKTVQQATVVLDRYLPVHNRKFAKPAQSAEPAWRRLVTQPEVSPHLYVAVNMTYRRCYDTKFSFTFRLQIRIFAIIWRRQIHVDCLPQIDTSYVDAGGLMSYGTNRTDLYIHAPETLVDKMLADGLTIPQKVLARAD